MKSTQMHLLGIFLLVVGAVVGQQDLPPVHEGADDDKSAEGLAEAQQAPPIVPPPDNGVPPGFESVLPANIVDQLRNLHDNPSLSFPEKREEFDRILNSVPGEILAKLPFPPGFEALAAEVKTKIQAIHTNAQLSWNEKSKQIGQLIESLPPSQRQFLPGAPPGLLPGGRRPNFPPTPPPGFEKVLPKEVYQQLLKIHQDAQKTPKEKIHEIDSIMRTLSQDILNALPLPPGFDQLPPETVKQARAIFSNTSLDYEAKNKEIIKFVKSLPADQRQLVKPPLPFVLNQLPKEVKDRIEEIFDDENLDEEERHSKFWKVVNTLPADQRAQIHQELGDGQEDGAGSVGPAGPFNEEGAETSPSSPIDPPSTSAP